MSFQFAHEPDARRYTMRDGNKLVSVVEYAINGNAISFNGTVTTPPYRGRGHAAELVEFAVNDVEQHSERRIVPVCWYVGDWFDAHPERQHLLREVARP